MDADNATVSDRELLFATLGIPALAVTAAVVLPGPLGLFFLLGAPAAAWGYAVRSDGTGAQVSTALGGSLAATFFFAFVAALVL